VAHARPDAPFRPLYALDAPIRDKVLAVARKMYGAREVAWTAQATRQLAELEQLGYGRLPVCIAKTPASLSDDPHLPGRPRDFEVTVRALEINAGAGFVVVLTGDILRMPGLPRHPLAEHVDLVDGEITGLE
jgi:formate--tetrahydrofolate ligase